jgi:hypothetical protein
MIVKIPYSMLIIGRLVGEVFEVGSFGSFHTNTPGFYTSRLERHRDGRIQKMSSLFTGYGTSPSRLPCLQGFPVPPPPPPYIISALPCIQCNGFPPPKLSRLNEYRVISAFFHRFILASFFPNTIKQHSRSLNDWWRVAWRT